MTIRIASVDNKPHNKSGNNSNYAISDNVDNNIQAKTQ